MALLRRRVVISTGNVKKPGQIHAPNKFPDEARGSFRCPHEAVDHVWWSPLAKLRSLSRGFEIVDVHRSPDAIDEYEVKIAGTGKRGKAAISVYVDTIIGTTPRGASYDLDDEGDLETVQRNTNGSDSAIRLPRASRRRIGLQYVFQVNTNNTPPDTLTVVTRNADTLVRELPDGTEVDGDQAASNTNSTFLAVACRRRNVWTIIGETKDANGAPTLWTLS